MSVELQLGDLSVVERVLVRLSRVFAIFAAVAIILVMLSTTLNVIVRFTTRATVPGTLELAQSCLVVAVFFGLAWAGITGDHVAVRLVSDRLSRTVNRVFDIIVWGIGTAFSAWITFASVERAIDATDRGETQFGLIEWPGWPWRWFLAAGLAAFFLVALANFIRAVAGRIPFGDGADDQPSTVPVSEEGIERA